MADFSIEKTWDGQTLQHEPVQLHLVPLTSGIKLVVDATFFGKSPVPPSKQGQPCANLWDYEVVEAFFLNDKEQYLEVELSPHGQHLLLMLEGCRNCIKDQLPLEYSCSIENEKWHGEAIIPASYFPPKVTRFNAYAIHGVGDGRTYEALYPVPHNQFSHPDFHRLEYFKSLEFSKLLPENHTSQYSSEEWTMKDQDV